jgi:ParB family chromosome partitioning protein
MAIAEGKSRLDLVKEGVGTGIERRGRKVVPIEKVVEDPRNERKTFRNMEGLITSVKSVGIIEPITVAPIEGDSFMIVTGHRRFRAAKAAGLEKIEVLVRDPEAEIGRRRKSIISNVQRENVGPIEMAEALQSLLDEDEAIGTQRRLADTIGKSEQWVCDMLKILEMPAPLQEKLRTSVVTLPYDSAAKVARLKDQALQEELVGELLKGASNRDIRARIDEAKGWRPKRSLHLKESYTTNQKALVIIESLTDDLSIDRQIAAMEEALVQARQKNGRRFETV